MGTYVVGDIHGCYTQFTQLRERIEHKDPNAVFVLVGDLVHRGPEEAKMLDWAYRNITVNGKYQMVLGNHDDAFIEVFGDNRFETIYSMGRGAGYNFRVSDEYKYLQSKKELMLDYAAFLASLPLIKKIEIDGKKFVIAHAWYDPVKFNKVEKGSGDELDERFCFLWERDISDGGEILFEYVPIDGEKLIHGHTPTVFPKDETHRRFSPGKVWDMGSSINVDCGLVFRVSNYEVAGVEYANLAAYCLETGAAEYLWDIPDGYAASDGEYFEDKQERLDRVIDN